MVDGSERLGGRKEKSEQGKKFHQGERLWEGREKKIGASSARVGTKRFWIGFGYRFAAAATQRLRDSFMVPLSTIEAIPTPVWSSQFAAIGDHFPVSQLTFHHFNGRNVMSSARKQLFFQRVRTFTSSSTIIAHYYHHSILQVADLQVTTRPALSARLGHQPCQFSGRDFMSTLILFGQSAKMYFLPELLTRTGATISLVRLER